MDNNLNVNETTEVSAVPKKKKKKKPLIVRFLLYFIPWKGDSIGEVIRKIIFLVSLVVIIFCIFKFTEHVEVKVSQSEIIDDMQSVYSSSEVPQELIDALPEGASSDFATLYAQNSDTTAWLSIPNAGINYVVMQSKDAYSPAYDKYLYSRNWKGEKAKFGWPYIDCRCKITKDKTSSNIIVYGHNMYPLDDTLFFSNLVKYESLDYYKQNPVIFFDTLYNKGVYKIFGVVLLDTAETYKNEKPDENTKPHILFDYIDQKYINLDNYLDFNEWYTAISERNLINTEVDAKFGDEFLTLSTCETRYFDEGRLVIFARKVREGESEQVNVSTAVAASDPLMPDIWVSKGKGKLMN